MTGGASGCENHETAGARNLTRPATGAAGLALRSGRGAGAAAGGACRRRANDDLFLATEQRFFEREALLDAQIGPASRSLPPTALLAPSREKLREKVLKLRKNVAHPRAGEIEAARLEPGVTELIV